MVLQATQALSITLANISIQDQQKLQREVTETEFTIRRAGHRQQFFARHNAQILGNPYDDVHQDGNLSELQIIYRDLFTDGGYVVSLDIETGFWKFDWSTVSSEQESIVYSIRTSIPVGAIDADTEEAIDRYFSTLDPLVTSKTQVVRINGGDILESDFGASLSTFYEFYSVVSQPDTADHSADLKHYLTLSGLGYDTSNIAVYKLVYKV